ncbi:MULTISPECIES: type II toxin-antitoxin system RelE/ParE family toxin [Modicisalibacter]|uniref:Type II toxin-antitoxin system RelE/ParE family toxin n=1 Tax=Modicisalibacter tunisiensis TaxID=390637 RepID=A0ABS7WU01_9GAMM|nr:MULTISPECIES: type II toxin-antitoxin system RelE/ParE family toxin [Modicisalibacter]MBZ9540469.1 type II toxin-antitoxin system RelE/ParE family toxin [Modicisalibacter tunisiensis]MBZ9566095.1 type II toxin-antitoxin system RelE/ParE family toxin [Modicisalibacter tunisiensis]
MLEIKQTDVYRKWERKLRDQRAKALIAARVFRLANGLAGDVKPVGQGVSELRIHHGPGYRVYFKQRGDEIILLLCGGDKSTQQGDVATAQRLAAEWEAS